MMRKVINHLFLVGNKSVDQPVAESKPTSTFKSPTPTTSTTTGYKYTPLRQSWSNLTQMNQPPSPYSPSAQYREAHEAGAKKLAEIVPEESDRESNYCTSPSTQKRISLANSRNSDNPHQHQQSRPQTADSVYGKRTSIEQTRHHQHHHHYHQQSKQVETNPASLASIDSLFSKKQALHLDSETDFDKNMDELTGALHTDFYTKYRTQNIRQKKSQRSPHLLENSPRPHSASNASRTSTSATSSSLNQLKLSALSSASNSDLNNPIGALYEMSKNYKPIESLGKEKV